MATHSSTLTWRIAWMEEPGGLQSMRSPRVRYDWSTSLSLSFPFSYISHFSRTQCDESRLYWTEQRWDGALLNIFSSCDNENWLLLKRWQLRKDLSPKLDPNNWTFIGCEKGCVSKVKKREAIFFFNIWWWGTWLIIWENTLLGLNLFVFTHMHSR